MKQSKKIHARLEARIKDYFQMVAGSKNYEGYKKPGAKTGNPKK